MQVLRGQLKKRALHTIEFTLEMWALAYIMIFNLYLVKNLMTLSAPRSVFLYDFFTHKEIDIFGHIYHLFGVSQIPRDEEVEEGSNTDRNWLIHFRTGGYSTTFFFSSSSKSSRLPWSYTWKGWRVAYNASFTHHLLHNLSHLPWRPNHCLIFSNSRHDGEI